MYQWLLYRLTKVFYGGANITEWNAISISTNNDPLLSTARFYYLEDPTNPGYFWRFNNGVPAIYLAYTESFYATVHRDGNNSSGYYCIVTLDKPLLTDMYFYITVKYNLGSPTSKTVFVAAGSCSGSVSVSVSLFGLDYVIFDTSGSQYYYFTQTIYTYI